MEGHSLGIPRTYAKGWSSADPIRQGEEQARLVTCAVWRSSLATSPSNLHSLFGSPHSGWLMVIGLTIAAFALGILVMSNAGTQAAAALRQASETGKVPNGAIGDSAVTFGAGALIAIPGFLTDVIKLLLLIPPIRRAAKALGVFGFARWARRRICPSSAPPFKVKL